jgi:hypothetical protein
MVENIVGSNTFDGYELLILKISAWAWENQDGCWLTKEYLADYRAALLEVLDLRTQQRSRHLKERIRGKLANTEIDPIIVVGNVTPKRFTPALQEPVWQQVSCTAPPIPVS